LEVATAHHPPGHAQYFEDENDDEDELKIIPTKALLRARGNSGRFG
jgi:hypothetical protein